MVQNMTMLTNKEQSALISKLLRAEVKENIDRIGIWQILEQDTNLQNKIKKYQHLSYIYGISGVISLIILFTSLNIAPPKTWLKGALMLATIIIPAILLANGITSNHKWKYMLWPNNFASSSFATKNLPCLLKRKIKPNEKTGKMQFHFANSLLGDALGKNRVNKLVMYIRFSYLVGEGNKAIDLLKNKTKLVVLLEKLNELSRDSEIEVNKLTSYPKLVNAIKNEYDKAIELLNKQIIQLNSEQLVAKFIKSGEQKYLSLLPKKLHKDYLNKSIDNLIN